MRSHDFEAGALVHVANGRRGGVDGVRGRAVVEAAKRRNEDEAWRMNEGE
jgi:hypothetical protein